MPLSNSALHAVLPEQGSVAASLVEDNERLRVLMANFHPMVWRIVRNFGVSDADVDDAVQQVFIVTSNKLRLIETGSERSFLAGVAVRVASRFRRSRQRRREALDVEVPDQPSSEGGPVEALDRAEARRLLERLLDTMPTDLRLAFVMYEIEELTLIEISVALEIPLGTAASRVRRARELFVIRARRFSGGRR